MACIDQLAGKRRRSWRGWTLLALTHLVAVSAPAAVPETTVKAVFLFHFTHFVSWPPSAFAGTGSPLVIGVWGSDPLDATLTGVLRGERAGRRLLVLRQVDSAAEAKACQILYVPRAKEEEFRESDLKGSPVLTVGESAAFLRDGGIIAFRTEAGHVRLRVNLAAARESGVEISSPLLRLAEVIERP